MAMLRMISFDASPRSQPTYLLVEERLDYLSEAFIPMVLLPDILICQPSSSMPLSHRVRLTTSFLDLARRRKRIRGPAQGQKEAGNPEMVTVCFLTGSHRRCPGVANWGAAFGAWGWQSFLCDSIWTASGDCLPRRSHLTTFCWRRGSRL